MTAKHASYFASSIDGLCFRCLDTGIHKFYEVQLIGSGNTRTRL